MPDIPLQWHSDIYLMLSHVAKPSVLLLPTEPGWSLLHLQYAGRLRLANVEHLQQIVAQSFDLYATVLRCVSAHTAHQQLEAIFLLENHSPGWSPPAGWCWVTREALAALPMAGPAHRAVLETCLAEADTEALPALRAPWARRGWFAQAQAWIAAQLERLDYVLVPPLAQVRSWGISCVLRVRTFTGTLYFKAASTRPLFAREAVVVQELAARYAAYIPLPVAVDPHQNWLLLADVGPGPAAGSPAPGDQFRSYRRRAGSDCEARIGPGPSILAAESAPIPGVGESSHGVVTHYAREKRARMSPYTVPQRRHG